RAGGYSLREHHDHPEACSHGIYVDVGAHETELPAVADPVTTEPAGEPEPAWDREPTWDTEPTWDAEPSFTPEPFDDTPEPDALPPISWRADGPAALPAPEVVPVESFDAIESFEPTEDERTIFEA